MNGISTEGGWEPDATLNRTDADITLMMLSQNDIVYTAPSDDPWMPAHIEVNNPTSSTSSRQKVWVGDYYVNLMGCIDQYQICNPNKNDPSACTKLPAPRAD